MCVGRCLQSSGRVYNTPLAFTSYFPWDLWSQAGEKYTELCTRLLNTPRNSSEPFFFFKVPHGLPQHSILSCRSASHLSQRLLPPLAAVVLNNSHRLFSANALGEKRLKEFWVRLSKDEPCSFRGFSGRLQIGQRVSWALNILCPLWWLQRAWLSRPVSWQGVAGWAQDRMKRHKALPECWLKKIVLLRLLPDFV